MLQFAEKFLTKPPRPRGATRNRAAHTQFCQGASFLLCLTASLASAGEPHAFLVSAQDYDETQLNSLRYTERDITALAEQLRQLGFSDENIVVMTQAVGARKPRFLPTAKNIPREFKLLLRELQPEDSVLVVFSGHGVQFKGDDLAYFCPIDAVLGDKQTLVSLSDIYTWLGDKQLCQARSRLLIVDACRNEPQSKVSKSAGTTELEPVQVTRAEPPKGLAAFFSCKANEKSFEHPDLEHGVFLHFVIEALSGKGDLDQDGEISLAELEQFAVKNTQRFARTKLGQPQTPERRGQVEGLMTIAALPRDPFVGNQAGEGREIVPGMRFRWCPPTSEPFTMGTHGATDEEAPVQVTLPKGFWLGETEVTQGQWQALMKTTPWKGQEHVKEGADYAASYISHGDAGDGKPEADSAGEFCRRVTEQERKAGRLPAGWKYALPTEAQWEYACRAGTKTKYSFGDDESRLGEYALYCKDVFDNEERHAHRVRQKKPNPWGLHDMHGNVWEWCEDWYQEKLPGGRDPVVLSEGSVRVDRGGGWAFSAPDCRSAKRGRGSPVDRAFFLGLRVAQVPVSK